MTFMQFTKVIRISVISLIGLYLFGCDANEIILHGEITGRVIDALTNQPLQGATVKLTPANDSTKTDNDGKYVLKGLTPGNYEIKASKQNYAEGTIDATVTSANTKNIDIALDAIPDLQYSETKLNFGFDLNSLSFTISKNGRGKVGYLCTPSQSWITINPNSGDVDSETDIISITINRIGLNKKRYNESIIVRATFSQYVFPDTINVVVWFHDPIVINPGLTYGNVLDIEGNVYKTVQIDKQIWMAENLRTTKYNDNTLIALVTEDAKWGTLTTAAYCWYNNDLYYKTDYGAFYNWFAVNTGRLCPTGWHVPSADELRTLGTSLGGDAAAYVRIKEIGTSHWIAPNEGTNESGFTALPSGYRWEDTGTFEDMGRATCFWSSEQYNSVNAYERHVKQYGGADNYTNTYYIPKQAGLSVRCIKDQPVKK
jgi:uncharacterized protein (TIGR02145 family)